LQEHLHGASSTVKLAEKKADTQNADGAGGTQEVEDVCLDGGAHVWTVPVGLFGLQPSPQALQSFHPAGGTADAIRIMDLHNPVSDGPAQEGAANVIQGFWRQIARRRSEAATVFQGFYRRKQAR